MHSQGVVRIMHVQVCTSNRCKHQRTHLFHARYRKCICAHVCAVCFIKHWGMRMGRFSRSMKALVAWRGGMFFDKRKDRGVVCVFSSFSAGGSVCGCMCVYTHTHTHTAKIRYSDVSPGVGMRHLEGPKNPDRLNLGIYIFIYVHKVHMCMYMLRGGMRSWTGCFLL